jgi:hypothetical protein
MIGMVSDCIYPAALLVISGTAAACQPAVAGGQAPAAAVAEPARSADTAPPTATTEPEAAGHLGGSPPPSPATVSERPNMTSESAPARARRVDNCVLPQSHGIPQELGGLKLDDPVNTEDWMRTGAIPELCLKGEVRALVDDGASTTHLAAWQSCGKKAPSCSNLGPYADALAAAWGISHKTVNGSYVFEAPDAQARLSVDILEGESSIKVWITRVNDQSLCHYQDGFAQFQMAFLKAVEKQDRDQVASYFYFPFKDELLDRVSDAEKLNVDSSKAFLAKYDRFVASARRSEPPYGQPSAAHCHLEYGGYVDFRWKRGAMVAEKRNGRWGWARRAYAP